MTLTSPRPSFLLALVLVLAACSSKAPKTERGVALDPSRVRTKVAQPVEVEPEEEAPVQAKPSRKLKSPFELGPGDLIAEPGQAVEEPKPVEEKPAEERDLGRELADMLGGAGCLDLTAAAKQPGGRLTISGTAYVMASGRITRATVSASGQPSAALRCAESRIVSQGMRGPIPGGPQSVSGSTTLQVAAEAPKAAQNAPAPAAPAADQPPAYGSPAAGKPEVAGRSSNYGLQGATPDEMAGAP